MLQFVRLGCPSSGKPNTENRAVSISGQLENLLFRDGADDFAAIERGLGGFCPFEAIGMVNQEIKHTSYLAYLLQPNNPHGFGHVPLRRFLNCIADASGEIDKLDIYTRDLAGASVRREWNKIDLLVEIPSSEPDAAGWVVAVEVKVNATESDTQLSRYADILSSAYSSAGGKDWKVVHIFLTLDGQLPSEENQALWAPMGFRPLVDELESVVETTTSASEESRWLLRAYVDMLRRHHLENAKLEELAKRLWRKHPEALSFLAERRPDPVSELKAYITENATVLAQRLSEVDRIPQLSYVENSPRSNIRFSVNDWMKLPGLSSGDGKWTSNRSVLAFELLSNEQGRYSMISLIGPGDDKVRQRIHAAAIKSQDFNKWKLGEKFFQLKRWDLVKDLETFLAEMDQKEAFDQIFKKIRDCLLSKSGIAAHEDMLRCAGLIKRAD